MPALLPVPAAGSLRMASAVTITIPVSVTVTITQVIACTVHIFVAVYDGPEVDEEET